MSPSFANTAIVLIDPYNDFLHPDGKMYFATKEDLARKNTIAHIKQLVVFARSNRIPIYYGLHQTIQGRILRWLVRTLPCTDISDNFRSICLMANVESGGIWPTSTRTSKRPLPLQKGSFGAQILDGLEPSLENGDVIVSKHWNSSSFHHTDLEFQLRQRDISRLVLAGMTANTCLEATARVAYELGFHITLLKDATAGFDPKATDAATEIIWPIFASHVITVQGFIDEAK